MRTWIKPLAIGTLQLENNLIQAPLAGISCAPFRALAHQYGHPAYSCTEMLSAHKMLDSYQHPRYTTRAPNEGLLCYQLSGNQLPVIQQAAVISEQEGADLIDLNCGCPVQKIRKKGAGSAHLADPQKLYNYVEAIKSVISIPLTVKIRVDGGSEDKHNLAVLNAVQDAGADALIVHGRHWSENYDTPVWLEQLAEIKQQAHIPVIANGDVLDVKSALRLFEATQCDGIMIGRGSVGQPWLYKAIQLADKSQSFVYPDIDQQIEILILHIKGLIELTGLRDALMQARRFAKYYFRMLPDKTIITAKICEVGITPDWEQDLRSHLMPILN